MFLCVCVFVFVACLFVCLCVGLFVSFFVCVFVWLLDCLFEACQPDKQMLTLSLLHQAGQPL